jgi:archaemetzincin
MITFFQLLCPNIYWIMQIAIQPLSIRLDDDLIYSLKKQILSKFFDINAVVLNQALPMKEVPLGLFDKQRNQWRSNGILQWLLQKYKPDRSTSTPTKILAICDFDAYSYGLNFVLGEAYIDGSITAIYLPRLRQEFYGLELNEPLFHERIVKEAVHELGHAFGLNHCENIRCVMHFSNSLSDTDLKEKSFCNNCSAHLQQ